MEQELERKYKERFTNQQKEQDDYDAYGAEEEEDYAQFKQTGLSAYNLEVIQEDPNDEHTHSISKS